MPNIVGSNGVGGELNGAAARSVNVVVEPLCGSDSSDELFRSFSESNFEIESLLSDLATVEVKVENVHPPRTDQRSLTSNLSIYLHLLYTTHPLTTCPPYQWIFHHCLVSSLSFCFPRIFARETSCSLLQSVWVFPGGEQQQCHLGRRYGGG